MSTNKHVSINDTINCPMCAYCQPITTTFTLCCKCENVLMSKEIKLNQTSELGEIESAIKYDIISMKSSGDYSTEEKPNAII
jgi:hypothetical protein